MANFRFLSRLPKHRTFQYNPRYYNEKKEHLERQIKMHSKEDDTAFDAEILREKIRTANRFSHKIAERKARRQGMYQRNMSKLRIFLILNVLLIIAVYLLWRFSDTGFLDGLR